MAKGRKPSRNARRSNIVVRLQDGELNAIKHQAKARGVPASTYIRDVLLNHFESNGLPTELPIDDPNQLKIDTD